MSPLAAARALAALQIGRTGQSAAQWIGALKIASRAERSPGCWIEVQFMPGGAARSPSIGFRRSVRMIARILQLLGRRAVVIAAPDPVIRTGLRAVAGMWSLIMSTDDLLKRLHWRLADRDRSLMRRPPIFEPWRVALLLMIVPPAGSTSGRCRPSLPDPSAPERLTPCL